MDHSPSLEPFVKLCVPPVICTFVTRSFVRLPTLAFLKLSVLRYPYNPVVAALKTLASIPPNFDPTFETSEVVRFINLAEKVELAASAPSVKVSSAANSSLSLGCETLTGTVKPLPPVVVPK